eukprot:Plantae.Rhodophyta-Rhodochaete_pulchella.ctg2166.p1 GENE.Plantae.Rhodophyta-Rhodochaete_pulchella.ctg2166~~Plantae.Rhodophyta-Rhodochaete_pulchella.ctg2166.p1  ORF type:complete len:505 (-),score=77.22 Plantae.Rhodophyta-Rhodochaete_pulchella.ctg2166:339-1853(-)
MEIAAAIVVPRIWMFLVTILVDVMMVRAFEFIEGMGAREALLCWSTLWTAMVVLTRPSVYALEAVCLAGILYSCFGTGDRWMSFWVVSAVWTAVGIHIRPSFFAIASLVPIHLFTLSYKPYFNTARVIRGAIVGLIVFFGLILLFAIIDSIYYGYVDVVVGSHVVKWNNFSFDQLGEMTLRGRFTVVPLNAILRLKDFKELRANYQPALGQIFTSLPVILGPLIIVLAQDTYSGTKKQIKELSTEFKNVSSGQGLGASSAKKKKKKKKIPQSAKAREDDHFNFVDLVQTTFLLCLLADVVYAQDAAGIVSMLPIAVPAAMMLGERVFGEGQEIAVAVSHFVYTGLAVILFGLCMNGGTARVALQLGGGSGLTNVIPRGSELVLHHTSAPPRHYLGRNPQDVSMVEWNSSSEKLMESLETKGYENENVFVLSPATVQFDDLSALELVKSFPGHICAESPPGNADEVVTKNALRLYKYQAHAAKLANRLDDEGDSAERDDDAQEEL